MLKSTTLRGLINICPVALNNSCDLEITVVCNFDASN
jgi:hypothetical protein